MTGRSVSVLVVLAGLTLSFVVGCVDGDSDVKTVSTKVGAPSVTEPGGGVATTAATLPETTDELGTQIVYAGLELTFNEVAYTPDPVVSDSGTVEITLSVTNPTNAQADIPTMLLQAGSEEIIGTLVDIFLGPAETKDTSVSFTNITGAWSAADNVLIVGASGDNRAEVPLDGSDPTFVAPTEPEPITGTASLSDSFSAELKTASIRGDFGTLPKQAPEGKVVLAIELEATTTSPSGFAISGDAFRLEPAGEPQVSAETAAFGDDEECCLVLESGVPLAGSLFFAVPEPGPGTYVLVLRDGTTTAEVRFAVKG